MTDLTQLAAVVPVQGEQTSSVELTTNAKGGVQIAVKIYDRDPAVAVQRATTIFDTLRARYAPIPAQEAQP
jgi:dienelactone hydrolase